MTEITNSVPIIASDEMSYTILINGQRHQITNFHNKGYFTEAVEMFRLFDDSKINLNESHKALQEMDQNMLIIFYMSNCHECIFDSYMFACLLGNYELITALSFNNGKWNLRPNKTYCYGTSTSITPFTAICQNFNPDNSDSKKTLDLFIQYSDYDLNQTDVFGEKAIPKIAIDYILEKTALNNFDIRGLKDAFFSRNSASYDREPFSVLLDKAPYTFWTAKYKFIDTYTNEQPFVVCNLMRGFVSRLGEVAKYFHVVFRTTRLDATSYEIKSYWITSLQSEESIYKVLALVDNLHEGFEWSSVPTEYETEFLHQFEEQVVLEKDDEVVEYYVEDTSNPFGFCDDEEEYVEEPDFEPENVSTEIVDETSIEMLYPQIIGEEYLRR